MSSSAAAKQKRHAEQEKAALAARARAGVHMKTKNVKTHAEIIAPMPKNVTNHRDNTLELVRKRKAKQLDAHKLEVAAKKLKAETEEDSPPPLPPPPLPPLSTALPRGPTWIEATDEERPEIQRGAARIGYGIPTSTDLPDSVVLPQGWIVVEDTTTKAQYFWNRTTNATSWGDPSKRKSRGTTESSESNGAGMEHVEKFHLASEHGLNRSYYWHSKSGQTSFDHVALTELTKPPVDEDAPEEGAPEGFQDAAGDVPRWEHLRNKAVREREHAIAQMKLEEQEIAAARKAEIEADED